MRTYTKPQLKSKPIALGVFGDYGEDEGREKRLIFLIRVVCNG